MEPYALVLSETAAMTLATAPRAEQRRLSVALDGLKSSPFRTGDFQERDAQGRINSVFLVGEWLITAWADHPVRELRIVRLDRVED